MTTFLYRFDVVHGDGVLNSTPYDALPARVIETFLLTSDTFPVKLEKELLAALPPLKVPGRPGPFEWEPTAIEHSELRFDAEAQAGELTVSLPLMHQVSQVFAEDTQGRQVFLTLALQQPGGPKLLWSGQAIKASFSEFRCSLTLTHVLALMKRDALTAKHSRECEHSLFDASSCRVKQLDTGGTGYWKWREDCLMPISAVGGGGVVLEIAEAANRADDFFAHGFIVVGGNYLTGISGIETFLPRAKASPVNVSEPVLGGFRSTIATHKNSRLELLRPLPVAMQSLPPETLVRVSLFAGCDSTPDTCKTKFGNFRNFGGYPFIPLKNVFVTGLSNVKS